MDGLRNVGRLLSMLFYANSHSGFNPEWTGFFNLLRNGVRIIRQPET